MQEIFTLIENVRSLYNVGAIFRTADGAGVSKLFLTGITGRPPHREIRKVALGAEESVEWEYVEDGVELAKKLQREGFQIVVLERTDHCVPYDLADYRFPLCLVIGHEFDGVSAGMLEIADLVVGIPMFGSKISLNVSVAFGIAIYEVLKRKKDR
jgi:tRNA G18 (ribose-2'-O)-methylase SpoU